LLRVLELGGQCGVPAWVCVNKHDLNPTMTTHIERHAVERGATVVGRIPYDPEVTAAQRQGRPLVELSRGPAATAMADLWKRIRVSLPAEAGSSRDTRQIPEGKETRQ